MTQQILKEISRSVFEEITEDLVESTIDMIYHALKIAREPLTASDIDEIILVGGSSYMPMIKKRLQKEFNCELRLDMFEPDRAVAKGAALHAAKLQGDNGIKVVLGEDMGARSYGTDVSTDDGVMIQNILSRTDPLVYENTFYFYTTVEGQTSASISLYENTSTDQLVSVKKTTKIMDKSLVWGTPVPVGTEIIMHVTRNKEGIVHVMAECGGKQEEFSIETKGLLGQNEVDAMKRLLSSKRV